MTSSIIWKEIYAPETENYNDNDDGGGNSSSSSSSTNGDGKTSMQIKYSPRPSFKAPPPLSNLERVKRLEGKLQDVEKKISEAVTSMELGGTVAALEHPCSE